MSVSKDRGAAHGKASTAKSTPPTSFRTGRIAVNQSQWLPKGVATGGLTELEKPAAQLPDQARAPTATTVYSASTSMAAATATSPAQPHAPARHTIEGKSLLLHKPFQLASKRNSDGCAKALRGAQGG